MRKVLFGAAAVVLLLAGGAIWLHAKPPRGGSLSTKLPIAMQVAGIPVVGTPTSSPIVIPVGVTTPVIVTTQVTDSRVVANGVNLLRLNPNGTSAILGVMHDDGLNGDAVSNDKIFSLKPNFNESVAGQVQMQVSAAFKGILKRGLSTVLTLYIGLPPDPGDAGKLTIAGVDLDGDGVRDDVQRYIAINYPNSQKVRTALTYRAKISQSAIIDADDPARSLEDSRASFRIVECLAYIVGASNASLMDKTLRLQVFNTEERIAAYYRYNEQLGGHVYSGALDWKTSCPFNPDLLPN